MIELLEKRGAACDVHDPFVPVVPNLREHPTMAGRKSVPLDPAGVAGYDAVLIVTDHDCIDYVSLVKSACLIVTIRVTLFQTTSAVIPEYSEECDDVHMVKWLGDQ